MNTSQIGGVLRVLVPMFCAWLATKGVSAFTDAGTVSQVTDVAIQGATAVAGVVAVVMTVIKNSNAGKIKAAANVDPAIQIQVPRDIVVTQPAIAAVVKDDSVPNVTALPRPLTPTRGVGGQSLGA